MQELQKQGTASPYVITTEVGTRPIPETIACCRASHDAARRRAIGLDAEYGFEAGPRCHGYEPLLGELEHYHNFTRARLVRLLESQGFKFAEYNVSELHRTCMEVIALKI